VVYYAKRTPIAVKQDENNPTINTEGTKDCEVNVPQQPQVCEIKEVTAHKTVKGTKGFHYRCVWRDEDLEPSWEPESHIKPTADKLLNLYWRSATKSTKPEGGSSNTVKTTQPLKQSLLHTTKRIQAREPV